MMTRTSSAAALAATIFFCAAVRRVEAQGSSTPPAGPAPSMKTLQELWDRTLALESNLAVRIAAVESQAQAAVAGTLAAQSLTGSMLVDLARVQGANVTRVWRIQTVDGRDATAGMHTSLAFSPTGRPCISYYDRTNADLKFAECTGILIGP